MKIIVLAHNIRSTYNIGSIFRTCEGFGVKKLYLTGYTPYPTTPNDTRPPHIRQKIDKQIHKTALGAEQSLSFEHHQNPIEVIQKLRQKKFTIAALEQSPKSILINKVTIPESLALILGEEVGGIDPKLLAACDQIYEIPMHGKKESFNVSVATGIALYALTNI